MYSKKEYRCPELTIVRLTLRDVIMNSPEYFNSYTDSTPGDWGDPSLPDDPDEPIIW